MKKSICNLIILSFFLGLICSCQKEKEKNLETNFAGSIVDKVFYITYLNSESINVLQTNSQIQVFYLKNGTAEKVERAYLDCPNGFTLTNQNNTLGNGSNELCVKVFPSDYEDNSNKSTTYIKFDNNTMDTFECQFQISSGSHLLMKIWLNGSLVWDRQTTKTRPLIQIIK